MIHISDSFFFVVLAVYICIFVWFRRLELYCPNKAAINPPSNRILPHKISPAQPEANKKEEEEGLSTTTQWSLLQVKLLPLCSFIIITVLSKLGKICTEELCSWQTFFFFILQLPQCLFSGFVRCTWNRQKKKNGNSNTFTTERL